MMIYRRTLNGWSDDVFNRSEKKCDICGEKLWVNPSGDAYCNGNWLECKPKVKK